MKPSRMRAWSLFLLVGFCLGGALLAPVARANTADEDNGAGELYIGTNPRGDTQPPGTNTGGDDTPGGLGADPDTFSVDGWNLRDFVRFDPWVARGGVEHTLGWILRVTFSKIFSVL